MAPLGFEFFDNLCDESGSFRSVVNSEVEFDSIILTFHFD
jgi:hypothetical protein